MPPYKRQDWNSLIDDVNDVLQNPTGTSCEPIDPIEHVDTKHRWAKSDIRDMQDKIKQTCPDITFEDINDLWHQDTIDEIREKLGEAWCDCEDECLKQCDNATNEDQEIIIGNFPYTVSCFEDFADRAASQQLIGDVEQFQELLTQCSNAVSNFIATAAGICLNERAQEERENQLEAAQDQLAEFQEEVERRQELVQEAQENVGIQCSGENAGSDGCADAQAELEQAEQALEDAQGNVVFAQGLVDALEEEIDNIQATLTEQRNNVEEYSTEADTAATAATELGSTFSVVDDPRQINITSLLSSLPSHPWGVDFCEDFPDGFPITPHRCRVFWQLEIKTDFTILRHELNPEEFPDEWDLAAVSSWTPNGIMIPSFPMQGLDGCEGFVTEGFPRCTTCNLIAESPHHGTTFRVVIKFPEPHDDICLE